MKACKFCGTQVNNTDRHCPSCGSSVFLNVCENCGTRFDSGFCPNCGVKAGQGKKICPDCSTAYFSNACPNCGYTPARKPAVQEIVHRHVYAEPEHKPQAATSRFAPVRARKKNKGCGCLTWIFIFIMIAAIFGNRTSTTRSTVAARTSSVKTTSRTTKDPNATAVPTATPEPAVASAQEKVDQYFATADESEIAGVQTADSYYYQRQAKEAGKVLLVRRGWGGDRGEQSSYSTEPDYIGVLGYAVVYSGEKLEKNANFGTTPWKIAVYRKDRQFWEENGEIDHKSEVVVIGSALEKPSRYSSRYKGYLRVIRMDTGTDCWIDVQNFVTAPYWIKSLTDAQAEGYCIAEFRQVSDYYPVTGGNEKTELEDGTLILLPVRSKVSTSSPDKTNNSVPAVVFKEWKYGFGGVTVYFNESDLTLIY